MYATTTIPELHNEYRLWTDELRFFKEEIARFEAQLGEYANRGQGIETAARVEQFQNRFIREKELIDELRHRLHGSERQLAAFVKELHGLGLRSIRMDNHPTLREEMRTHRRLYAELKDAFRKFGAACN